MIKKILFILTLIGYCFFPKIQLVQAGIGTNPISLGNVCFLYLFFCGLYFIYQRRQLPIYGKIWEITSLFFLILFATLLGGYIKDRWKNKDYGSALLASLVPLLWFLNKVEKTRKKLKES